MAEAPNRYDDPYWSQLAEQAESKNGLPDGLLRAVLLHGERSNNNQVSSAQAKTPFQIIPSTRDAFLKKYGVDAYLSPENAATVAGLHLKESLDRNNGNPMIAIAEYNAAPSAVKQAIGIAKAIGDESTFVNYLPAETRAYVPRTVAGWQTISPTAPQDGVKPKAKSWEQQTLPVGVLKAYQENRMTPDEQKELERDISSGMWTLPKGESLKKNEGRLSDQIPGHTPQPEYKEPSYSLPEKLAGGAEAALSIATGIPATVASVLGTVASAPFLGPEKYPEQRFKDMQGALTYQPRTEAGRDTLGVAAKVLDASKLAGIGPAEGMMAGSAMGAVKPAISQALPPVVNAVKSVANPIAEVVAQAKGAITPGRMPTPGTMASGGSAGTDIATIRQIRADDLPVPVKLTEGQKTRDFGAQRFERETAKDPQLGEPIRERFAQQNRQLQQNLDSFIDMTGAEAPDVRSIGLSVDKAIRDRAAKDKAKIRVLYRDAEKAGEMEAPVNLSPVGDYLNQNRAGRTSAPIMQTVADEIEVQGLGSGRLADGKVTLGDGTLRQAEDLRKTINRFAKSNDPNDIRVASDIKGIIDQVTEGAGGKAYAAARRARARYGKDYENISLVKNIIGEKRGSADRAIALEDVLNRSIITPSSSLDDVRNIRRLLQTGGDTGQQAWKELQGGTLKYIKDQSTKNVARNELGDPIVSASQMDRTITALDKSGKLEFIFGKKGAEQLRTINEVAKDVLVAPPGSVNTSNTASVLLAAMDMAISGAAGLPIPVLSGLKMAAKSVKNSKTRARVTQALK